MAGTRVEVSGICCAANFGIDLVYTQGGIRIVPLGYASSSADFLENTVSALSFLDR
jgi:hypothetical protein